MEFFDIMLLVQKDKSIRERRGAALMFRTRRAFMRFLWDMIKPFRIWAISIALVSLVWAIDLSVRPYLLKIMLDTIAQLSPIQAYAALWQPALYYLALTFLWCSCFVGMTLLGSASTHR